MAFPWFLTVHWLEVGWLYFAYAVPAVIINMCIQTAPGFDCSYSNKVFFFQAVRSRGGVDLPVSGKVTSSGLKSEEAERRRGRGESRGRQVGGFRTSV